MFYLVHNAFGKVKMAEFLSKIKNHQIAGILNQQSAGQKKKV